MALRPASPIEILMLRTRTLLQAVDWPDLADLPAVNIRFKRNRPTRASERPCIAIDFVGDDVEPDTMAAQRNMMEEGRILQLDLQLDMDLPPENSEDDVTGMGQHLRVLGIAYDALAVYDEFGGTNGLWDYVDDVRRDAVGPDEDSKPDEGRLVQGISMIYRVSSTNSNRLLAPGVTYP